MSDTPRRRLADRVSSSPTFVGAGSKFIGNFECESDLLVGGFVKGDAQVHGALTLLETGRWEGKIQAAHAVIAGEVHGTVVVTEKLELRGTARIRGSVSARTIAVAQGAIIDGEMAVTSGTPVVHYEERRKASG